MNPGQIILIVVAVTSFILLWLIRKGAENVKKEQIGKKR